MAEKKETPAPKAEKKTAAKATPAKKAAPKKATAKEETKEEAPKKAAVKATTEEAPKKAAAKATTEEAPKKPARARKAAVKPEVKEEAPAEEASEEAPAEVIAPVQTREERLADLETARQSFDWSKLNKKSEVYSEDERTTMEEEYNATLTSINEHEVLDGTVVSMTKREVVVNIGYKSEGVIPTTEFRHNPDLKPGDSVEVYVEMTEDAEGQLVLSHKKARMTRAWENVNLAKENDTIVTGHVKCRTKGGLIVDVFGLEAFLPRSQIDVKPVRNYDIYVGKDMEFKVVKINNELKDVVV